MNIEKELERIAKAWDGCKTQVLGGEDDVGKLLRYEFKRVLSPLGAGASAWKPLTDVQWMKIVSHDYSWQGYSKEDAVLEAVNMVEAKLKEVNTTPTLPEAAAQEGDSTDAETYLRDRYGAYRGHFAWRELEDAFNAGLAAKQAQPVALTDDVVQNLWQEAWEIGLREAGAVVGNADAAHASRPYNFAKLLAAALATHPQPAEADLGALIAEIEAQPGGKEEVAEARAWAREYIASEIAAPSEGAQVEREAEQRKRMEDRFANRVPSPATADFDLPAQSDAIEGAQAEKCNHHFVRDSDALNHECCQKCGKVQSYTPATPAAAVELPPLPWECDKFGYDQSIWEESTESMAAAFHDYARAAVALAVKGE